MDNSNDGQKHETCTQEIHFQGMKNGNKHKDARLSTNGRGKDFSKSNDIRFASDFLCFCPAISGHM